MAGSVAWVTRRCGLQSTLVSNSGRAFRPRTARVAGCSGTDTSTGLSTEPAQHGVQPPECKRRTLSADERYRSLPRPSAHGPVEVGRWDTGLTRRAAPPPTHSLLPPLAPPPSLPRSSSLPPRTVSPAGVPLGQAPLDHRWPGPGHRVWRTNRYHHRLPPVLQRHPGDRCRPAAPVPLLGVGEDRLAHAGGAVAGMVRLRPSHRVSPARRARRGIGTEAPAMEAASARQQPRSHAGSKSSSSISCLPGVTAGGVVLPLRRPPA